MFENVAIYMNIQNKKYQKEKIKHNNVVSEQ